MRRGQGLLWLDSVLRDARPSAHTEDEYATMSCRTSQSYKRKRQGASAPTLPPEVWSADRGVFNVQTVTPITNNNRRNWRKAHEESALTPSNQQNIDISRVL